MESTLKKEVRDTNNSDPVVVVNPKPSHQGFISKAIDMFEKLVVQWMHDPSDPPFYLQGNFAPVDETPPTHDLPVQGSIPESLNGEFVRIGPNPKFPPVANYLWLDGDGMVHGIRIKDGKATYVSRYVRTARIKQEEFFKKATVFKYGDLKGLLGLFMGSIFKLRENRQVLDDSYGHGNADDSLVYHNGRLLALHEETKPYALRVLEDGDLETLGILDYNKKLSHNLSSHPKIDPVTGELFTFGFSHTPPYVTYRVISKEGIMNDPVPITVSGPILLHSIAITKSYAIIMDLPLYYNPEDMVKKDQSIYNFDVTRNSRFGILPRYAKNELLIKWFELPNCYIWHCANAWEEGDEVVLICFRMDNIKFDTVFGGTMRTKQEFILPKLYEMRFNMNTGNASQKELSPTALDFPTMNESYIGRKHRYVYACKFDNTGMIPAIVKFDLQAEPVRGRTTIRVGGNIQGIFELGPGKFGSEAIFVPRNPGLSFEEDDGHLIFFVHDEITSKSSVYVIDAQTMSPDPIAVIELPKRVPYGFHALFVTEEQLQEQKKSL